MDSDWWNSRAIQNPDFNFGQYDCDAPILLAQNALNEMQTVQSSPDFILYSGDMSAHDLPTSYDRFTAINDTISLIYNAFPNSPIYPTLGNNDCYPDYYLNYSPFRPNIWLKKIWSSWSIYSGIPSDQEDNFINAGYYVAEIKPKLYLISLNTIYVCGGHNPDWDPDKHPDPAGQFAWLNSTLLDIELTNGSAYILGHLPPNEYWHHDYVNSYVQIIKRFENTIVAQFFGHTHKDEMHLITDTTRDEPYGFFLQTPSLTPKDSNNPSFRLVDYDTNNYMMTDYSQYITGLLKAQRTGNVTWIKEYSFKELYGVPGGFITTSVIQSTIEKIMESPTLFFVWKANYACQYEDPDDKLEYYCEMIYPRTDDIELCLLKGPYQEALSDNVIY